MSFSEADLHTSQTHHEAPKFRKMRIHAGSAVRLRSKQHLLDTLVERARDQNAYTRARVLQTWASLAVSRSIDMGHWLCVAELAVGMLPLLHHSSEQCE